MTRKEDRKRSISQATQLPDDIQKIEDRHDKPMDAHTGPDGKVDGRKMNGDYLSIAKDGREF